MIQTGPRNRYLLRLLTVSATALFISAAPSTANQWPNWRGPAGNGSIQDGRYPTEWTKDSVTWKLALPGKGGSTPIVWNERIYLTTPLDGEDALLAIDLAGHKVWQTQFGKESPPRHRTLGSSCNSSPVTDGSAVFVYFRSGRFAAVEFDGKIRWTQNLTEKFGPENLYWDQGSSPVVTDQHVILSRMHQGESWLAGFDKKTGEMKWLQPRNYRVPAENDNGYSTPLLFKEGHRQAVLLWGADHLTAHDASTGAVLWSAGGFNPDGTGYWPAISTPVIIDNLAIVPVGRDDRARQSSIHAIRLGGSGDVSATHRAWKRDDVGVFVPALAEYQGKVYLLRNRGDLVCLNPADGRTVWEASLPRDRTSYYASPLIANGILYAAREDGTVFTAKVGDRFELLGEHPMGERIVASPVPAGNHILLRSDNHLFCIAAPPL